MSRPLAAPWRHRATLAALSTVAVAGALLTSAAGAEAAPRRADADLQKVPRSLGHKVEVSSGLRKAKGKVQVSVALSRPAVAASVAANATRTGNLPSAAAQKAQTRAVQSQQAQVVTRVKALGARVTGRATRAVNAVTLTVDASKIDDVAKVAGVVSIKPVAKYHTTAAPTPGSLAVAGQYLGAAKVHAKGVTGKGVRVAILDSGIDITHANLGGPGTEAAYKTCFAQADDPVSGTCAKYFGPKAPKVKGGFDFVGETWTGAGAAPEAEKPDPNPIDQEGHGTHVADILGGRSADGKHVGIAPGVDLYAVKVCSAVATACSGPAILQGLDWALDPNGDGAITDAVDLVNLSLGSDYGQAEDDSTVAVDNALRSGVVVVTAAGNAADRPFIVGSPSTAAGAISVAQTALPDESLFPIHVDSPTIAGLPDNTVRYSVPQPWSPLPSTKITGPLAVPAGSPLGCTAADFAGFPAGAIALISRGTCNASLKAQNAQAAGAKAVVIYNNVPGDPPSFSFGGGAPVTVPTLTISLDRGKQLAAAVAKGTVTVTIDPAEAISLRNTTVGTSSRGPALVGSVVKPDIGSPGAWLSAEVGTGAEETSFGGTSGATPTVGGVAALILQKHPKDSPLTVKARLLGTADLANATLDADANRYPTPVSRIGAGEVRAYPAVFGTSILENRSQANGNIGLGQPHLTTTTTRTVKLRLANTSKSTKTYLLSTTLRQAADANFGAVSRSVSPTRAVVRAGKAVTVTVKVTINPAKLPRWPFTFSAGAAGAGADLNDPEIDGTVVARSRQDVVHLGWHVLPHRSADVSATPGTVTLADGKGSLALTNASKALEGGVEVYGLTGTSGTLPAPVPGGPGTRGSNQAVVDLAAVGVRDDLKEGVVEFAIADRSRHGIPLYPAGHEVDIDVDRNGTPDYFVFQQEPGDVGTTGLSLVFVQKAGSEEAEAFYYTVTDFDSAVRSYPVPLAALGLKAGSTFDFSVVAYDAYFSGIASDRITGMSWTVGAPTYTVAQGASFTVPAGKSRTVTVERNGSAGASSQKGLLLWYADAKSRDFQVVTVK